MKYCINCGVKLADEAKFCSACGYKQPQYEPKQSTPTATSAASVPQQPSSKTQNADRKISSTAIKITLLWFTAGVITLVWAAIITQLFQPTNEELIIFGTLVLGVSVAGFVMYYYMQRKFTEELQLKVIEHAYDSQKHRYYTDKLNTRRAVIAIIAAVISPIALALLLVFSIWFIKVLRFITSNEDDSLSEMK